jgi:hypothetical protein
MPVTTRSQARCLSFVENTSAEPIVPRFDTTVACQSSVAVSSTIMSSSIDDQCFPLIEFTPVSGSLLPDNVDHCSAASSVSNFQNFELSNYHLSRNMRPSSHNSSVSNNCTMEEDCQKSEDKIVPLLGIADMNALFEAISTKLMSETTKISKEVQQVIRANEDFKQAVRDELDELRNLVLHHQGIASQNPSVSSPVSNSPGSLATSCTPVSVQVPVGNSGTPNTTSNQDVQTQMMLMMTKSFSKLSTAFSEGKSDSKSDWPKFSGDNKNFRSWYMGIMTQISLPPWSDLYDCSTHDVVKSTSNIVLNGKLYSKIILALEGTAYKNFVS